LAPRSLLEFPEAITNQVGFSKARQPALLGFLLRALFLAEDDFTLADELVVEPNTILVGGALKTDTRRPAEQSHTCRGLENIGRKRTAVDVEFDAKIAGVGDPGDLITGVEYNDLGYESNEYGTLCHFSSAPYGISE
jgi:hypothetical protein